jgi:hypothetical protein
MLLRIRRSLVAALWLIWPGPSGAPAAPPLTTVQDVLYKADGTRFNGTLTISWNSFQAPDNSAIVTQSTTVKVQDGLLRVQLVPTTTSTPPSTYSVTYNSDGRVQFQESWSVPPSATPLHVRDVRTSAGANTGSTSGSSTAGADTSGSTVQESGVVGLIADLGARPVKSPSFAPGRTAVVDSSGLISSAAGNATDCVHVDGSSGPCGSTSTPSFVDGESPSGIVDGSNTVFGLATVPDPGSLAVYRNGMLQKTAQDYTLAGSTVTFVAGATPQPGDTLLASYRLSNATGDSGTAAASYSAPEVLCSGTGFNATAASLVLTGTCSIPAGLLAAGDRVEIRFDYAHQGSGAVSIEVDWGATTLVHRDAPAGETLITGHGSAAIEASGAQLSAQSWGGLLPFAAAVAGATDNYTAGIAVNFMGSVAQSGDILMLNNFSVVRIP